MPAHTHTHSVYYYLLAVLFYTSANRRHSVWQGEEWGWGLDASHSMPPELPLLTVSFHVALAATLSVPCVLHVHWF